MANSEFEFEKLCSVTIQGGGVFGVSLLGQLSQLTAEGYQPVAYSGSSAGALISTLAWAGYDPEEILNEIQALTNGSGLKHLLKNKRSRASASYKLMKRLSKLEDLEQARRKGLLRKSAGSIKDLFSVLRTARLLIFSKMVRHRGILDGRRIEDWIEHLISKKIFGDDSRTIKGSVSFKDIYDFDKKNRYSRQLLFIGVANLSRDDFFLINSHSKCFEEMRIADAVRASISFPGVFAPKDLRFYRDASNGRLANSETFDRGDAQLVRETFVDGGVVSNFPAWTTIDVLRESMFGGSSSIGYLRPLDANGSPDAPLRAVAFRPMVHFGLQIRDATTSDTKQSDQIPGSDATSRIPLLDEYSVSTWKELRLPNTYWKRLFQLVTSSGRARLEEFLFSAAKAKRRGRTVVVDQPKLSSGWGNHAMDLSSLDLKTVGTMYDQGAKSAASITQNLKFSLPYTRLNRSFGKLERYMRQIEDLVYQEVTESTAQNDVESERTIQIYVQRGGVQSKELTRIARPSSGRISDYKNETVSGNSLQFGAAANAATCIEKRSMIVGVSESGSDSNKYIVLVSVPIMDTREPSIYDGSIIESDDAVDTEDAEIENKDTNPGEVDEQAFSVQKSDFTNTYISSNKYFGVIFGAATLKWNVARDVANHITTALESPELMDDIDNIVDGASRDLSDLLSRRFGASS